MGAPFSVGNSFYMQFTSNLSLDRYIKQFQAWREVEGLMGFKRNPPSRKAQTQCLNCTSFEWPTDSTSHRGITFIIGALLLPQSTQQYQHQHYISKANIFVFGCSCTSWLLWSIKFLMCCSSVMSPPHHWNGSWRSAVNEDGLTGYWGVIVVVCHCINCAWHETV